MIDRIIRHQGRGGKRFGRWARSRNRRGRLRPGSAAAVLVGLGLAAPYAEAQCHTVTDLGTLPGASHIHVRDVNDAGQVVGYAYTDRYRAFLYTGGQMVLLGTLGGAESYGHGINDAGQVVGAALTDSGQYHAFLYTGGMMIDLGTLGGNASFAHAINNAGQVAGYSDSASGECHAFLWESGTMTDLGEIGLDACEVWDINEAGQIVGGLQTASDEFHAFLWDSTLGIVDLGTLGNPESYPYRISDSGQIVGAGWTGETNPSNEFIVRAFLYRNGETTNLGTLGGEGSAALGINNQGQIVGWAQDSAGQPHAFLYDSVNGLQDLNGLISPSSGWFLDLACAINDAGWIAGTGFIDGQQHACLLTPDPTDADNNGVPDACEAAQTPDSGSGLGLACGPGTIPMTALMWVALACLRIGGVHPWRLAGRGDQT